MMTTKSCQSSLGKGLDWMTETTLEDLGNGLVRGWTYRKPRKAWEIDQLLFHKFLVLHKPEIIYSQGTKPFSLLLHDPQ